MTILCIFAQQIKEKSSFGWLYIVKWFDEPQRSCNSCYYSYIKLMNEISLQVCIYYHYILNVFSKTIYITINGRNFAHYIILWYKQNSKKGKKRNRGKEKIQ